MRHVLVAGEFTTPSAVDAEPISFADLFTLALQAAFPTALARIFTGWQST